MSVGRYHGANNQEGTLTPVTSPWGEAMLAATDQLIDQPAPIGKGVSGLPTYGGTVGGLTVVAASIRPLVTQPGYFGNAPDSLQGEVDAPEPWLRT